MCSQNRAGVMYGFSLDTLNIVCHFEGEGVTVTQIQHIDLCDRSHLPTDLVTAPPANGAAAAESAAEPIA